MKKQIALLLLLSMFSVFFTESVLADAQSGGPGYSGPGASAYGSGSETLSTVFSAEKERKLYAVMEELGRQLLDQGHAKVEIDSDIETEEITEYLCYVYLLGTVPQCSDIVVHRFRDPGQRDYIEIVSPSEQTLRAFRTHREVTEYVRTQLAGRDPSLETVLELCSGIASSTSYDGAYGYEGAYGLITEGRGVCDGYSKLFNAYMRELGIESRMVVGYIAGREAEGLHSWNVLDIGGTTYTCDLTWAVTGSGSDISRILVQDDSFMLGEARSIIGIY